MSTSSDAYAVAQHTAPAQRERILAAIRTRGVLGMTCYEVEVELDIEHQTASARMADLKKALRLAPTGLRRPTRSGCLAEAWKAAD